MTKVARARQLTELAFETERLSVRHWQGMLEDDRARGQLRDVLAGLLTPSVLEHLPPALSLESAPGAIDRWIGARAQESECYTIRRRTDQTILGLLILVPDDEATKDLNLHIGYLFAQDAWGQGYATELVAGVLQAAQNQTPICFLGGVAKGNPASARVLQKLGFVLRPELSTDDTDIFSITTEAA